MSSTRPVEVDRKIEVLVEEPQVPQVDPDFPDGGLRAWLVVIGCAIIAAVTTGLCLCWGVFYAYYSETILSDVSPSTLSLVGSLPGALMTVLSIITGKLADRYQYRPLIAIGCVLWVVTMLGIAFSTKLWHFIFIQGILQGVSGGCIFPLTTALPSQWFLKKRAFATGIVLTGTAFGAAVASAMIREMLTHLGLRKTMAIKTCIDAVALGAGFLLLKERNINGPPQRIVWYDKKYLTDPIFWSIACCMCFSNFGYPAPFFYLPTYTTQNVPNQSQILAALTVTMINVSSGFGRCFSGFIADYIGVTNTLFAVVLISGLAQLLVWSFVHTYPGIMALSVLYGFFGLCFWSLVTPVAASLYGTHNLASLTGLVFLFAAPGELLGPPITGAIYSATSNWHYVIIFSGMIQVIGALCLLYARFKRQPKLWAVI